MGDKPIIEIQLPKRFSPGAQTFASIVVEATQKGVEISEELGQIIAAKLGVSKKELDDIQDYLAQQVEAMIGHLNTAIEEERKIW